MKTTIQIDTELREEIVKHGKYGESINDILKRLVSKALEPKETLQELQERKIPSSGKLSFQGHEGKTILYTFKKD
jgi:negative regulator of replication initiation